MDKSLSKRVRIDLMKRIDAELLIKTKVDSEELKDLFHKEHPNWKIITNIMDSSEEFDAFIEARESNDPDWMIVDFIIPDVFGDHSEITLSEFIHKGLKCDVLIFSTEVIDGIDPQNPWWGLLHKEKKWFFCDICETKIDGPCYDDSEPEGGYKPIKIIQELDLKDPREKMYLYKDGTISPNYL